MLEHFQELDLPHSGNGYSLVFVVTEYSLQGDVGPGSRMGCSKDFTVM